MIKEKYHVCKTIQRVYIMSYEKAVYKRAHERIERYCDINNDNRQTIMGHGLKNNNGRSRTTTGKNTGGGTTPTVAINNRVIYRRRRCRRNGVQHARVRFYIISRPSTLCRTII